MTAFNKAETEYLVSLLSATNNKRYDRDEDGYIRETYVGWEKEKLFGNDRLDFRTRIQLARKGFLELRSSTSTGTQNIGSFGTAGTKRVTSAAFFVRLTLEGLRAAKALSRQ